MNTCQGLPCDQPRHAWWLRTIDGSEEIAELLYEAQSRDSSFVQEWIDRLRSSEDLQSAVELLGRDWPRFDDLVSTPEEKTLFDFFAAIESVALAKQLEKAAIGINANGESTATVLSKIGQPLEDILLSDLALTPSFDVSSLIEILVGTEITSN